MPGKLLTGLGQVAADWFTGQVGGLDLRQQLERQARQDAIQRALYESQIETAELNRQLATELGERQAATFAAQPPKTYEELQERLRMEAAAGLRAGLPGTIPVGQEIARSRPPATGTMMRPAGALFPGIAPSAPAVSPRAPGELPSLLGPGLIPPTVPPSLREIAEPISIPTVQPGPVFTGMPTAGASYEDLLTGLRRLGGKPTDLTRGVVTGYKPPPTDEERAATRYDEEVADLDLRLKQNEVEVSDLDREIATDPVSGKQRAAVLKAELDDLKATAERIQAQIDADPVIGKWSQALADIEYTLARIDDINSQIDVRLNPHLYPKPPTTAFFGPTPAHVAMEAGKNATNLAIMQGYTGGAAGAGPLGLPPVTIESARIAARKLGEYLRGSDAKVGDTVGEVINKIGSLNAGMGRFAGDYYREHKFEALLVDLHNNLLRNQPDEMRRRGIDSYDGFVGQLFAGPTTAPGVPGGTPRPLPAAPSSEGVHRYSPP